MSDEAREYLRRRRDDEGSNAALARRLGVSQSYVSYLLRGKRPVPVPLALRVRETYPELLPLLIRDLTAPEAKAS